MPRMPGPQNQDALNAREMALVRAIQAGQADRWSELLTPYQDRLYAVCLRMLGSSGPRARQTAADLTQDAMVRIIQGLPAFDGSSKLSTWMIRVTMNVCLSHLRALKHRRHPSLDAPAGHPPRSGGDRAIPSIGETLAGREPPVGSGVELQQTRRLVADALGDLDAEQRAILVLRDVRGLDYDQIALVLGIPNGTVKSRLFRARAALREALQTREPQAGKPIADDP